MKRLSVEDLQASRIPAQLNVCPTSERFYAWVNEAEELMLNQGRWWGSIMEAQFCVEDGCLVLPRAVAAVEQAAVCGSPIDVQGWGYGYTRLLATLNPCQCGCDCSAGTCSNVGVGGTCGCGHLQMRVKAETAASWSTTRGANKKLRVYPGSSVDTGKTITFFGRDKNGIWVRTNQGGSLADGERVTLTSPFVDTVTTWGNGAPQAVSREATQQRVLVYEVDTVSGEERALAEYEPSETRPEYRVVWVPGLVGAGGCGACSSDGDTTRKTVTMVVSLGHVELGAPGDWLVLRNLSAYKAAMRAVKAWEDGDVAMGNFYFYGTQAGARNGRGATRLVNRGGAIPLLQAELRKMGADRTTVGVYLDESERMARMMAGFR